MANEIQIIGRNMRRIRREAGQSQKQVARILGVTYQQVQKYETGRNRLPADKLYRLKQYYGVPYSAFFEVLPGAETYIEMPAAVPPDTAQKIERIIQILLE